MPDYPAVDDELLYRVITGSATESEREVVDAWKRASTENERRYLEVVAVLDALAADEATILVPPSPAASAVLAYARSRERRSTRSPWWRPRRALVAGLATVSLALGVDVAQRWASVTVEPRFGGEVFAAGSETGNTVTLLDGTRVELGPRSSVRTELRGTVREVWLAGRASFDVASQAGRGFMVRTPVGDAVDIGTQFTVRIDPRAMQIVVFQGKVGLTSPFGSAEAGPGELIAAMAGRPPLVTRVGSGHSASDWVRAALVFERAPMEDVASVLESHYDVRVQILDTAVRRRTVSAWFVAEPSVQEAFTGICRAVDVRCSFDGSLVRISQ